MKLRILLLAAGTTATLFAQAKLDDEVLKRGRERILAVIEKLANYTCTETVNRQEFVQTVRTLARGNCDQIDANRKNGFSHLELVQEDRLRLDVEVTDRGIELYSWPGASRIASEHVQDFVGEGVFQTGAFGPFLINVFSIPGVRFWSEGTTRINGHEVRQYRYLVPMEASHYRSRRGRCDTRGSLRWTLLAGSRDRRSAASAGKNRRAFAQHGELRSRNHGGFRTDAHWRAREPGGREQRVPRGAARRGGTGKRSHLLRMP